VEAIPGHHIQYQLPAYTSKEQITGKHIEQLMHEEYEPRVKWRTRVNAGL
jgi:hypothetical protein